MQHVRFHGRFPIVGCLLGARKCSTPSATSADYGLGSGLWRAKRQELPAAPAAFKQRHPSSVSPRVATARFRAQNQGRLKRAHPYERMLDGNGPLVQTRKAATSL